MKKAYVLAVFTAAAFLLASCGSSSDGGSTDKAKVASKVASQIATELMGGAAASKRTIDLGTETVTEDGELGGKITLTYSMSAADDFTTFTMNVTVTFNEFKVSIDGDTYTLGGGMTMTATGGESSFHTTQTGTMSIDGESFDIDLESTITSTTDASGNTTQVEIVTGTVAGEPVNATYTYKYDSEGNEIT